MNIHVATPAAPGEPTSTKVPSPEYRKRCDTYYQLDMQAAYILAEIQDNSETPAQLLAVVGDLSKEPKLSVKRYVSTVLTHLAGTKQKPDFKAQLARKLELKKQKQTQER